MGLTGLFGNNALTPFMAPVLKILLLKRQGIVADAQDPSPILTKHFAADVGLRGVKGVIESILQETSQQGLITWYENVLWLTAWQGAGRLELRMDLPHA
jgi:hypothetical protein